MIDQGTVFEGFRLLRALGQGWLGDVYAATDLDTGTTTALRILSAEHVAQHQLIAQFSRLFAKTARLKHANILEVGQFYEREHRAYYTMTLAQSGSVRQLLQSAAREGQYVDLILALDLVRQAAAGLEYAHRTDLMHGDLKPENMLLQGARSLLGRQAYTVQLSDFGVGELRAYTYGTHDRLIVTTPAYMSPEQCRGQRAETRSDIYALGVVLYELLTGLVPFETKDVGDALEKHQHVAPIPPGQIRRDIPEDVEEIVLTCLAKTPEYRYATPQDLHDALQRALNRLMPQGPSPTVVLPELPEPRAPQFELPRDRVADPRIMVLDDHGNHLRTETVTANTVTVGRAPKNDIILEHSGVSRHHLNVEVEADKVFVTDLSSTNGSALDRVPLPPMKRVQWPYGEALRVEPYWLVLVSPQKIVQQARISVSVEPSELELTPGEAQSVHIQLANTGRTVDHFRIEVEGAPLEWVQAGLFQEVQLNPGTRGKASLRILVPRVSNAHAGEYAVKIVARSRENAEEVGSVPMKWIVAPFTDTTVEVAPVKRTTWFRTSYALHVRNGGNVPITYDPSVKDDEGAIRLQSPIDMVRVPHSGDLSQIIPWRVILQNYIMQLREGLGKIRIASMRTGILTQPGESFHEPIRVRVPIRWIGTVRTRNLQVHVASDKDKPAPITVTLQQNPVIPLWLLPILLLLLGLVWLWLMRAPTIDVFRATPEQPPAGKSFTINIETQNARRVHIMPLDQDVRLDRSGKGSVIIPNGITAAQRFDITAYGRFKNTTSSLTVTPQLPPPNIVRFEVMPAAVAAGQTVTIRWEVKNVKNVTLDPFGTVAAKGEVKQKITTDTTFRLSAANGGENVTRNAPVKVLAPIIQLFKVTPENAKAGDTVTIQWRVANATTVTIDPLGTVAPSGRTQFTAQSNATYRISASNGQQQVQASGAVSVTAKDPRVTLFTVSPTRVKTNQPFTITWQTQDATSVELAGLNTGTQSLPLSGSITQIAPNTNVQLNLTLAAKNAEGKQDSRQASVTVVLPPTPPKPAPKPAPTPAPKPDPKPDPKPAPAPAAPPSIVFFTASTPTVQAGNTVTLKWKVTGVKNVTLQPLNKQFPATGSVVVKPVKDTTYTLQAGPQDDLVTSDQDVSVTAPPPPSIALFTVNKQTVQTGESVTLKWKVTGVKNVTLQPLNKQFPATGNVTLALQKSTKFTLQAGPKETPVTSEQTVTVTAPPPPAPAAIAFFSANRTTVKVGESVTLKWKATGVKNVTLQPLNKQFPATGSVEVKPVKDTTYTLQVGTKGLTSQQRVTVTSGGTVPSGGPVVPVTPASTPARIVSFSVDQASVNKGEDVTLSWNVQNAKNVSISNVGRVESQGTRTITIRRSMTFTLRAVGDDGKPVSTAVRVDALAAPPQGTTKDIGGSVIEGTWNHSFGQLVLQVNGTAVTGTFTNDKTGEEGQVKGTLARGSASPFVLNGKITLDGRASEDAISFVVSFSEDLKTFYGPYSTRSAQERWCGWRPGTPAPTECFK